MIEERLKLTQILKSYDLGSITPSELIKYCWENGNLEYKLDDLQIKIKKQIESSIEKSFIILSSRQIGKSFLSVIIALEYCINNPGKIVRILAPTLKQVFDIVNDNLLPVIADAPPMMVNPLRSKNQWQIGESSLRLGALERAHVDGNRGGNASLIIYEEGGFVASDDYRYAIQSAVGPQLIRSNGIELHISSPSEDENHYLHTSVLPRCEQKGMAFRYTVYDSPSLTQEQIDEAAKRCGGYETEAFQREYLARIIRSSQLMVIPEFDETSHVGEFALPEYYTSMTSIDMGGKKDKTAILLVVWDFLMARLLVWDELIFDENTTTAEIIAAARVAESQLKTFGKSRVRWADVHGQSQVDMINEYGYYLRVPEKQDADSHVNFLRLAFTQGKILIHPRCQHLIGCIKHARYNDKRTDFQRSPVYGHCDALMALVYAYRMADKNTNPYPGDPIHRDSQFRNPHKRELNSFEKLAKQLVPFDPTRRAGKI